MLMKPFLTIICAALLLPLMPKSQSLPLTTSADGGNRRASVSETIGVTDVAIDYNRPRVKGRDGKIWGQLIPAGYVDQGFGTSKSAPWRAGANENTTIAFSTDVTIEGKPLPAGKYGFFVAYGPDQCTLIFSRNSTSWGSFFYDPSEDVLRVNVKPVALDNKVEWLKYEFTNETDTTATVALEWEKLMIPFTVGVDYASTQLASFRRELRSERGFTWEAWNEAAAWCLAHNTNYDEALLWANNATDPNFGGNTVFTTWNTKAQLLRKLGKDSEADSIMKKAQPMASMAELHQYGRQLLAQKKVKEAMDVFTANYKKFPHEVMTNMGLARAYSAEGDYKTALKYVTDAQALTPPNGPNNANLTQMAAKLKNGQDIN
jgi:hypothetical protein